MDQEMEADEFFPDKLISDADIPVEDIGEETDVVREKGGAQTTADDNVVNGNDGGRVTEAMDTDDPTSVSEITMETEGGNVEVTNDLEELFTETTEIEESKNTVEETTAPSVVESFGQDPEESKTSFECADKNVSEQELGDEVENFNDSKNDNLNLESDNQFDDVAGDNVDNTNLDSDYGKLSVEAGDDVQETLNVNEELGIENEREEVNKNNDDILDLEEPLTQSEETEGLTDIIENDEETKDKLVTESLGEDQKSETVQIQDSTYHPSSSQNTENFSQVCLKSNLVDDKFGQVEDNSNNCNKEDLTSSLETAKKVDVNDVVDEDDDDDDISLIALEETGEDISGDKSELEEYISGFDVNNEEGSNSERKQEIENSTTTEVDAGNDPGGLSSVHTEDEVKDDFNEEDLLGETELSAEEKTFKDISPDDLDGSDVLCQNIEEEASEENENTCETNSDTVKNVEDSDYIGAIETKGEMEINEQVENIDEDVKNTNEDPDSINADKGKSDKSDEEIEEKDTEVPFEIQEEDMDVDPEVSEGKLGDTENMDVVELAEDTEADRVDGSENTEVKSTEQEQSEEPKEKDPQEMLTDTESKDLDILEADRPDKVAITNTETLETEQSSDLPEISNDTPENATLPNEASSSESSVLPDTVTKSMVQTQDERSDQSRDNDVTSSREDHDRTKTIGHCEVTNSDDSVQSESCASRKSPAFDMSSVKVKEERVESTESDKVGVSETSQSGDSNLKISSVVSEDSQDSKGGQSGQTFDTVTAKGDNAGDKEKPLQDNVAEEKVKVKQELALTEKESSKKVVPTDDEKKKVKQESNKVKSSKGGRCTVFQMCNVVDVSFCPVGKMEEDDDVIAVKEEKKPVQKPKPSKIQTCIVCSKVGKCKYNIVRNGDVKHLCDDTCFKQFRSSPTTYLKQAESAAQVQSKPDNQSNNKPSPAPAKTSVPVKSVQNQQASSFQQQSQVYKTCTVCQLMNVRTSKPFLNWQGLDFCGEECLGKYQAGLSNNCSYCSGAIFPNNKAKFCCRVGNEVKHFCSTNCNNDYVKRMKLCAFCNKDLASSTDSFMAPVGETFKDFCSQTCLQKFEEKNSKDVEIVGVQQGQKVNKVSKGNFICAVCGKVGPVKHEFKLESKMNRLCSDPCFSAFQYANKLTLNTCDNCGTNLNSENQAPQYVQFEGQQRRFCSFMCVNSFRNTNKKTVPCAWCANKKSNFDMIERVDAHNKYQLFCSLNCLSLYRVNLQATSNQAVSCDQCRKFVPAQYHLTMSDASVRNFCSYSCVMQFQAQFQTPAKQVPQQNSLNSAVIGKSTTTSQHQQTTTTRSGRVVTKAPKVAAAVQQAAVKGRGGKKEDSFPVISNVISLAPQGTQQQTVVKPTTQAVTINQESGIKTTTTTAGNQTVQQQIIIQPPPPAAMKNKSLLCKPFTQTKATSCRPHTQIKEVQTEGKVEPEKYLIPVPVPVYCPTPLAMYSLPTPVLIPVPVPIPVPVFIPTTKKSAHSILKQIKEIREKIPADPLEAELLMMAEAVAGKEEESSSSSEDEDNTAPPEKETSVVVPPTSNSGGGGGELGEDMLQMALRMASEMSDEPVMDLENSLEPVAVNTEPPPQPKPVIPSTPQSVEEEDDYIPASARSRRSRGGNKRQTRSTPRRNPKRQKVELPPQYHEPTPSPPAPAAPPPDANFHLKYTYGVNAFKHWVIQKNSQIEQASKPGHGKHLKTFKTDILQCTADELNYSLCLFVKEVRKPNGEEYAVDSIYYLCLGIQQYLFENGRIDNIFTDFYYERFTEGLNEILTRYEPKLNHAGQLVCRIEEEHLWESKQLGAHSPHVLLNSLVYFNTKYFMLKTSEDHLKLSFTHIMKHWKKTASGRGSGTGPNAGRSVYLRYYCPTPQGKDNQKKKKEEMPVYEQTENLDNPLRCPVKLYEFYLSKCPESIKNRNDTFYLKPERSSVPDSPVWYSNQSINVEHLTKLLNRIRLVREIQEAHLHTQPIYI